MTAQAAEMSKRQWERAIRADILAAGRAERLNACGETVSLSA